MSIVLHLIPAAAWYRLGDDEPVTNASLLHEGFIHCTDEPDVMLQVANAFYSGHPGDFVTLHVDVDRLISDCIWEEPAHISSGDTHDRSSPSSGDAFAPSFPHVYGPINRDAVLGVQSMLRDPSGRFSGYGDLDLSC